MKKTLTLIGTATLGAWLAWPALACMALPRDPGNDPRDWKPGLISANVVEMKLDTQRAFLWAEKDTAHVMLSVMYSGGTDEFAWIVPVESKPKIEVDKGAPFSELGRVTAIAEPQALRSTSKGEAMAAPGGGVVVLERREEGPYDLAVLAASNSGGLYDWLKANRFAVSKNAKGALDYYVQKKFVFLAARIRNAKTNNAEINDKLKAGTIAPLHLSYKAKHLSYPLKATSGNVGSSRMEIYVLGGFDRLRGPLPSQTFLLQPKGKEQFAVSGPANLANPLSNCPTLRRLIPQGGTLVKYAGVLDIEQRQKDLVFAPIANK
jgi:hypothetical protein